MKGHSMNTKDMINLTTKIVLSVMTSAVLTGAVFADARSVTVGSPDKDGSVTVTIGGEGTKNQTLIAAWANGDKGNDPLDWTEYADAGTVAPTDTSKTFQIPDAWRAKSGAVKFFLMSDEKPYGKRYDYITRPDCADEGLYIDTGIRPDSTLDISVKLKSDYMSSAAKMCPFGINGVVFIMPKSKTEYYYVFFGAKETTANGIMNEDCLNVFGDAPPHDANPHTFRLNREGLFIDGYRHLAFDQSEITGSATTSTITLFGRRGSWKQTGTTCSIYGATLFTNGILACDLVPVAAPSGKIQMWDRVTRGYKGPAGSQKDTLFFVAGNDIGPYPSDCGEVESVSDAVHFAPAISMSSPDYGTKTVAVTLSSDHDAGLLLAVAGLEDAGTVFSNWTTNALVQKVAADVDEVTFALPADWIRNHYNIRFAWKSIADQPYDCAVEELVSTGEAYIRTGWIPTTDTAISVTAKTASDVCAFGITGCFFAFQTGNNIYWSFFGNSSQASCDGTTFPSSHHEWRLGPSGAFVDGTTLATFDSATESTLTANILLPFRAAGATSQTPNKTGDASVRSAKIWEGDILVRDFVPCIKNGVPVFYDVVRGGYYGSRTETPFVAGAPVVADGDILSWSNVRELRKGLVIAFR